MEMEGHVTDGNTSTEALIDDTPMDLTFEEDGMSDSLRKPKERDHLVDSPTRANNENNLSQSTNCISLVVDRKKTCPFLLRVFVRVGGHHLPSNFSPRVVPSSEFQIFTWKDATLKEIARLIQSVFPPARKSGAKLSFRVVYRKPSDGEYAMRNIGQLSHDEINPSTSGSGSGDEVKSADEDGTEQLGNIKFFIGDFLDVAVFHPRNHP